jgi:hypothetical protein
VNGECSIAFDAPIPTIVIECIGKVYASLDLYA